MNTCHSYTLSPALTQQIEARIQCVPPWLEYVNRYLAEFDTHVTSIKTSPPEVIYNGFNIMAELVDYVKSMPEWSHLIPLLKQCKKKLTPEQRLEIRQRLEVDPAGIKLVTDFGKRLHSSGLLPQETDLLLNPFTSILNLHEIYWQVKKKVRLTYTFKGITHRNIVIYYGGKQRPGPDVLRDLIARVCLFPHLLNSQRMPEQLTLYWIEFRKEFIASDGNVVFTSSEINTGVTDGRYIAITRKEEALKTVLHELIHFYDMDYREEDKDLERRLTDILHIENMLDSLNLYEGYTETMASYLNEVFNSWMTGVEKGDFKGQVIYTLYKLARILKLSGCGKLGDQAESCRVRQTTNVASYFMIKTFLYVQFPRLVKECTDPKTGAFLPKSWSTFRDIILQGTTDPFIAECLAYILRADSKQLNEPTARMTCLG